MRFGPAAAALALILAACGGGGDAAQHGEESHGEAAEHAEASGHGPVLGPADAHAATPAPSHGGDAAHWSYANQGAWAESASVCASGHEQSPINLSSAAPMAELPDLVLHYLPAAGGFANNGHTLQFTPEQTANTLTIGNDAFGLVQFHFHASAEHTLDRRAFPVELHLVHRNSAGQLAVVGVFIEEGAENPALAALLAAMPAVQGDAAATHLDVDFAPLLPSDRAYFAYAGSLTTPPCSEGVRWSVLRSPISASAAQIAQLREALGASSRHVQPLFNRTVLLGS